MKVGRVTAVPIHSDLVLFQWKYVVKPSNIYYSLSRREESSNHKLFACLIGCVRRIKNIEVWYSRKGISRGICVRRTGVQVSFSRTVERRWRKKGIHVDQEKSSFPDNAFFGYPNVPFLVVQSVATINCWLSCVYVYWHFTHWLKASSRRNYWRLFTNVFICVYYWVGCGCVVRVMDNEGAQGFPLFLQ